MTMLADKIEPAAITFDAWMASNPRPREELHYGVISDLRAQSTTVLHAATCGKVFLALHEAIKQFGVPCRASVEGPVVRINEVTGFIPDVFVECNQIDNTSTTIKPVIVVEVLSDSTAQYDMTSKVSGYMALEHIAHYLVIDPVTQSVLHFERGDFGGTARIHRYSEQDEIIDLAPPGMSITLFELFDE